MNRLQDTVRDRELAKAKEKLAQIKPENYPNSLTYKAVVSRYENRIKRLERLKGR